MLSTLIAYFIIPAYTLFFVRDTPWFKCNLSVIGSYVERKDAFILLGFLLGLYFFVTLKKLQRLFPKRRLDTFMLYAAFFFLLAAVIIPYLPATLPFWAFLHIGFAMTASLLLLVCLARIVWQISRSSAAWKASMHRYWLALHGIVCGSVFLFLINNAIISTSLEIFFILTTVWMSQGLRRRVLPQFVN